MTMPNNWSSHRVMSWVLFAVVVLAGPMTAMADEEPNEADGLEMLRTANDAFDDEDFEKAYDYYASAYDVLEEPLIKYRMGQTADKLDRVEEAVDHYEAYREVGDDEEFLARIDEALPGLKERLPATVKIVTDPEGATVSVEADETTQEVGTTPTTFEYRPGDVVVELQLEGYETETIEESLEADGDIELEATLTAVDEPDEIAEVDEPVPEPDVDPDDGPNLGIWGWTSAGLGASVLALGGVMSFFQADATQRVNEFDRQSASEEADTQEEWDEMREKQQGLRDDAQSYYQAATGAYIAGGILTASGLGLLAYDALSGDSAPAEDQGVSFEVGIAPGAGFVGINTQF